MNYRFKKKVNDVAKKPKMPVSHWTFVQNGDKKEMVSVDVVDRKASYNRVVRKTTVRVV